MSTIDLEYGHAQIELNEETSKHCIFGLYGEFVQLLKFQINFDGLAKKSNWKTSKWRWIVWSPHGLGTY